MRYRDGLPIVGPPWQNFKSGIRLLQKPIAAQKPSQNDRNDRDCCCIACLRWSHARWSVVAFSPCLGSGWHFP